jgi:hypothetical protein
MNTNTNVMTPADVAELDQLRSLAAAVAAGEKLQATARRIATEITSSGKTATADVPPPANSADVGSMVAAIGAETAELAAQFSHLQTTARCHWRVVRNWFEHGPLHLYTGNAIQLLPQMDVLDNAAASILFGMVVDPSYFDGSSPLAEKSNRFDSEFYSRYGKVEVPQLMGEIDRYLDADPERRSWFNGLQVKFQQQVKDLIPPRVPLKVLDTAVALFDVTSAKGQHTMMKAANSMIAELRQQQAMIVEQAILAGVLVSDPEGRFREFVAAFGHERAESRRRLLNKMPPALVVRDPHAAVRVVAVLTRLREEMQKVRDITVAAVDPLDARDELNRLRGNRRSLLERLADIKRRKADAREFIANLEEQVSSVRDLVAV